MTIDELIEKAEAARAQYGGTIDVLISQWNEDSTYSAAETAGIRMVGIHDEEAGEFEGESRNFCIADE